MESPSIECVEKSTVDSTGQQYAKFVAEPLDRGYGITLGNSLRRVLLADLEGAAITAIKIEGIQHEFSVITGIEEDVLDIIMNLKQLSFVVHGESPKTVRLYADQAGKVLSSQIECDSEIECVSKDQVIATMQEGAVLDIEMRVESGKGFVPSEQVKREDLPLGWLPIDAIYMPVHKVNYRVENTRVGQITNFDRLVLEVWTDGSIDPEKAISTSASILVTKFNFFTALGGETTMLEGLAGEDLEQEPEVSKEESLSIEELELSIRAYNCLKRANIFTLADLLKKSERELMEIKNFGRKSAEEVIQKVKDMGYQLRSGGSKKDKD